MDPTGRGESEWCMTEEVCDRDKVCDKYGKFAALGRMEVGAEIL